MPKAKSGQLKGKKKMGSTKQKSEKAFVAQSRRVVNAGPKIQNRGARGDIRVCHEEYVGTIAGSTAFACNAYAINPGNPILFPWLSQIATRYESYRFSKLQVNLNTRCATSTAGVQVLAVDFDASDLNPTSMVQARAYRSSVADAPWQRLEFHAVSEDLHKATSNYVRTAAAKPADTDVKLYDVGNLFVITDGEASTAVISELVVSYEIDLITPQQDVLSGLYASVSGTAGLAAGVLFGTDGVVDTDSTLPVSLNAAGDTLTFLVNFQGVLSGWITGNTIVGAFTNAGTATCTVLNGLINAATSQEVGIIRINALAGQTWKPAITSAVSLATSQWKLTALPTNV